MSNKTDYKKKKYSGKVNRKRVAGQLKRYHGGENAEGRQTTAINYNYLKFIYQFKENSMSSNKRSRKVQWDPATLNAAFALVDGGMPIREAARTTGIPFSSLQQRLKQNDAKTPPRLGRHPVFTKEQEEDMASQIKLLGKIFYGCTAKEVRRMAFKYAERNNVKHNFNKTYEMAGRDWLDGFLKRNHLSVRRAEGTSLNRALAFNREEVGLFFKLLGDVMEKYQFPPRNIYNVDETGVTSVQDPGTVVTETGQKRVGSITSGERGQNVTLVYAMSATGQFVPPMLIYPRIRHSVALEKDGPREALYRHSKNGWINEELFVEWLNHFIKFAKPSENDKVLLILDNHSSHISFNAYQFCKKHHIIMLSLPPHGSHRMQPLDVSVYGPFKTAYKQECNIMMKSHLQNKITQNDIASLVRKSFQRVATISNAEAGFAASGIYPYNPNIFSDEDFLPADVLNTNELEITVNERRVDDSHDKEQGSPSLLIEETESDILKHNQDFFNPDLSSVALPSEKKTTETQHDSEGQILLSTLSPTSSSLPLSINNDDPILSSANRPADKQTTAVIPSLQSLAYASLKLTTHCNNPTLLSANNTPVNEFPIAALAIPNYSSVMLHTGRDDPILSTANTLVDEICIATVPPPTFVNMQANQEADLLFSYNQTLFELRTVTPPLASRPPLIAIENNSIVDLDNKDSQLNPVNLFDPSYDSPTLTPKISNMRHCSKTGVKGCHVDYDNPIPSTSRSSAVKFCTPISSPASCNTAKDLIPIPTTLPKKAKVSRKQHATIITGTPNKIILFQKEEKRLAKLKKSEMNVEKQKHKPTVAKKKVTQNNKPVKKEKKTLALEFKRVSRKILQDKVEKLNLKIQEADLRDDDDETDIGEEDGEENFESQRKKLVPKKRKTEIKTKQAKKIEQEKNMKVKARNLKKKYPKKYIQSSDDNTSNSEIEMTDLKDDDDDTDIDIQENENKCIICGDDGQDNELWFRCVLCGGWAHAECTGRDSAEGYICDLCSD